MYKEDYLNSGPCLDLESTNESKTDRSSEEKFEKINERQNFEIINYIFA